MDITRRSLLGAAGAGVGLTLLSGCSPKTKKSITIGSKGFAESWIMGEMYAQGLRELGYQVDLKTNVGSTEIIDTSLRAGQVDIYPEYTGVIVVVLAGNEKVLSTAEQTYDLAKKWEEEHGSTLLNPTPFENKNAIAVTKEFAEKHHLKKISDLRNIGEFTYSTYPENVTGGQGYEGIVDTYGLDNMKLRTLSIGLNYRAIEHGEIQAADVFTTDPQLVRSDLVVLDDDKKLFGFQNVAPVIRKDVWETLGSEVPDFLNKLHSLLTTEAIQVMNEAAAVNRLDPAQVAQKFLVANKLI